MGPAVSAPALEHTERTNTLEVTRFVDCHRRVVENCSRVIVGKNETISLVLTCLLCGGHVL